jgi:putative restriction endonuclease
MSSALKAKYEYKCQICSLRIETPAGFYSEGAHIRPLGTNHNGADLESNLLCLCPNHHTMLDYGAIYIDDDLHVFERDGDNKIGKLHLLSDHLIDKNNIAYQRSIFG